MFSKKENTEQKLNEEQRNAPMPYYVHEGEMYRAERTQKRLWIVIIILIIVLVGTNTGWIIYESQFEDVTVDQMVDTGEGDAYVTGVGDLNYGKDQAGNPN